MDTVKNFSSFCAVMLAAAAYPGVAQTNLPTFNVSSYGASGSSNYGTCSGQAGSHVLTNCSTNGSNDFQVGQGIHLIGVGRAPLVSKLATKPTATLSGSATGSHQYCYVVAVVDPFGGISEPSQSVCTSNNLPDPLSYNTAFIYLDVPGVSSATANELSLVCL